MKKLFLTAVTVCLLSSGVLSSNSAFAEDSGALPILTVPDIINALEDACPCMDIEESPEEELREENSPLDELTDLSAGKCKAKISNPGRYRRALRYFADLGLLQFAQGESIRTLRPIFKEGQNDCKANSGRAPRQ